MIGKIMKVLNESHMYVSDKSIKRLLAKDLYEFMEEAYKWVGGFQSFEDEEDLSDNSHLWYITYEGELPSNEKDIDVNKIYTASVYKQKHGLKLVGIGNNRFTNYSGEERKRMKEMAASSIQEHLKFALSRGWMEVSGPAESMVKRIATYKDLIDPEDLKKLEDFKDITISPDNLHYIRELSNGKEVEKIAYGKIK